MRFLTIMFININILQSSMENKKRVVILVAIALVLATTAVTLNIMSPEISTIKEPSAGIIQGGVIGINIIPSPVEDKLLENTGDKA